MKRNNSRRNSRRNNEVGTRGQLLRAELGETADHALRAAGHAAGGVSSAVKPRVAAARDAMAPAADKVRDAFAPLTEAARTKVSEAKQKSKRQAKRLAKRRGNPTGSRRRWPMLAGLLAVGAAAGAVAAVVLRRRRQEEDEDVLVHPPAAAGDPAQLPADGGPTATLDGPEQPAAPAGDQGTSAEPDEQREHQLAG